MNLEAIAVQVCHMALRVGSFPRLYERFDPSADHVRCWAGVFDNYDTPVTARLILFLVDGIFVAR